MACWDYVVQSDRLRGSSLAGQQLGNLCGIYSTLGITGHFVLFFTIHFGVPQNEGKKCVVYTALWASVVILYWFLQYTLGGPQNRGRKSIY